MKNSGLPSPLAPIGLQGVGAGATLGERVRGVLPALDRAAVNDIARIVGTLVDAYGPERVYLFGSYARGSTTPDRDVDLLAILKPSVEHPHRLAQDTLRRIGVHALPLDLVFISLDEFEWRIHSPASLPATVLREGRILHHAA